MSDAENPGDAEMTLAIRREIMRRFMAGENVYSIANWLGGIYPTDAPFSLTEQVFRDHIIKLEKQAKKGKR